MSAKKWIIAAISGLAAAALAFAILRPSGPKGAALAGRQQLMETLGQTIAKTRPDCKVIVLSNPFTKDSGYLNEKSQFERAGIRGLEKGLGGRSSVTVVFPEIRPEYTANPQSIMIPSDCRTPLSFLIQASSVDQLADASPECDVIVSLIGLPAGVERLNIWNQKDPRSFALLLPDLRLLGPPSKTIEAFRRGKLLAAVATDIQTGKPLVITRENVTDIIKRQPSALGL